MPERIAVLLEAVPDREVAELGGVAIPAHGVAAGPVAGRRRPHLEGHAVPLAGVEPRAPHPGQVPTRSEVPRAPLDVRLEPAAREHDSGGRHVDDPAVDHRCHTVDAVTVGEQMPRRRAVADLDAGLGRQRVLCLDEPWAAARRVDREPAPESQDVADLERLPSVGGDEPDPEVSHPSQGGMAAFHQRFDEVGVRPVLGDPRHVVVERRRRVDAEVRGGELGVAQVAHELSQVIDRVVDDPHGAGRERRVPAPLLFGRPLQHEHLGTALAGGQSGTHCGVAAADHDDVGSQVIRHQITSFGRSPRNSASTATSPSSVTINGFTSSELIQ